MSKPIPPGITFEQPLIFGEWPVSSVQLEIDKLHNKYDLSNHELESVSRGGYVKCQGYKDHPPCGELVQTYGKIIFRRVK